MKNNNAFSLIELLVAMAVLSILLGILLFSLDMVSSRYVDSEQRVEAIDRARATLELLTRELTPAVVDTRMQFVVFPAEELRDAGAATATEKSPVLVWLAPLGANGDLRLVGYYLDHNRDEERYRLKRMFIRPDNTNDYFPTLFSLENARDLSNRTDPISADWFLENWDQDAFDDIDASNDRDVVSSVADGVLGFWVQCYDTLGNPIPWLSESNNHPASDMMYNSASYFHMANTLPFDDGTSFAYLQETPQVMKAHRLPATIEIAIYTVGNDAISRLTEIPQMEQVLDATGSLDLEASINALKEELEEMGVREGELLTTRVKLSNGG